eukprot:CAMPEP_0119324882 /NCGR_PEP_ID=MMETSP1333-20130426/64414_1 /TAXON_ID=418940 /ORGANISM="Scyphosphaera apsteinii, Strain RCC1455" /LENGTH=119 /DNA_ID=CAMNT_0007332701 /DNA_START=208 /DNA_END=564 /DNA_ORIENTATION=+
MDEEVAMLFIKQQRNCLPVLGQSLDSVVRIFKMAIFFEYLFRQIAREDVFPNSKIPLQIAATSLAETPVSLGRLGPTLPIQRKVQSNGSAACAMAVCPAAATEAPATTARRVQTGLPIG